MNTLVDPFFGGLSIGMVIGLLSSIAMTKRFQMISAGIISLPWLLSMCSPALAANGIEWDGVTTLTSFVDPQAAPPAVAGARTAHLVIPMATTGQISMGYITLLQLMFPSATYQPVIELDTEELGNLSDQGSNCPYVQNKYDTGQQTLAWEDQAYIDDGCAGRPDPHLFSSGSGLGFCLDVSANPNGSLGWLRACWDTPNLVNNGIGTGTGGNLGPAPIVADGNQYLVQVNWFTGSPGNPPYAVLCTVRRGGPGMVCYNGGDYYLDGSYFYPADGVSNDGFNMDLTSKYYQVGGQTLDATWVFYTTFLGATGPIWLGTDGLVPTSAIAPVLTFLGSFIDPGSGGLANLGQYGEQPLGGYPPVIFLNGGASGNAGPADCNGVNSGNPTYDANSADCAFGVTIPQQYATFGYQMTDQYNNPNFIGVKGGNLTTAGGW